MSLTCILFYVLSGLLGLLIGKFVFGKSKEEHELISSADNNKRAFDDLSLQFQDFQNKTHEKMLIKDAQITKLTQDGNAHNAAHPSGDSEALQARLKDQKLEIVSLKAELEREHESTKEAISRWEEFRERMKRVKTEYDESQKLIKKLRRENLKLGAASRNKGGSDDANLTDAKAKIKSLKSQLKHSKKYLAKAREENGRLEKIIKTTKKQLLDKIEVSETLDMKKLINLLKKGKLSSINKKVSRKKSN